MDRRKKKNTRRRKSVDRKHFSVWTVIIGVAVLLLVLRWVCMKAEGSLLLDTAFANFGYHDLLTQMCLLLWGLVSACIMGFYYRHRREDNLSWYSFQRWLVAFVMGAYAAGLSGSVLSTGLLKLNAWQTSPSYAPQYYNLLSAHSVTARHSSSRNVRFSSASYVELLVQGLSANAPYTRLYIPYTYEAQFAGAYGLTLKVEADPGLLGWGVVRSIAVVGRVVDPQEKPPLHRMLNNPDVRAALDSLERQMDEHRD